jgi:hypothetical protein
MKIPYYLTLVLFLSSCDGNTSTEPRKPINYIRGTNITCSNETKLTRSDIDKWKSWNINTVRINFNKDELLDPYSGNPKSDIWNPYQKNKERLKEWLEWMNGLEIQAIISLDLLWGDDHNSQNMWLRSGDNEYLNHRIEFCFEIEKWAHQFPNVVYIEVWNEPYPNNELYLSYFLPTIKKRLDEIADPIKFIVMAPAQWGAIEGFKKWNGLNSENIVYSTHIYAPWLYTHQNIYNNPVDTSGWPGWHRSYSLDEPLTYMDIQSAREYLKTIADFKQRTGNEVLITEFGVLRWAKDNEKYLKDLLTVLEENQLQWTFHSMAGWNGWNPTFSAEDPEGNEPFGNRETPALSVLKNYWQLNN